jgi:hypothetical protein
MNFKIFIAVILILVRTFLFIKVVSWVIINFISQQQHPLTEIQNDLILILLDMWLLNQPTSIVINQIKED